jgi:hypothetical protein
MAQLTAQREEQSALEKQLLATIKSRLPELESLLTQVSGHWQAEDGFYRFYHQSLKVYGLQSETERIVTALRSLLPAREINKWFAQIISEGTGKTFDTPHNGRWLAETRPILEAFFHARTMLEYAIQYGRKLDSPPQPMPSGWAAVLYLFDLR